MVRAHLDLAPHSVDSQPTIVGVKWMLHAAAKPELFLTRGLARFMSARALRPPPKSDSASAFSRAPRDSFSVELPLDLVRFFEVSGGQPLGDYAPSVVRASPHARITKGPQRADTFTKLEAAARQTALGRARLCAYLAGALPFGLSRSGALWLYVLGEEMSPARGVIVRLEPASVNAARVIFRGASTFAFACALDESRVSGDDALDDVAASLKEHLPAPTVAEQEGVRAAFERARMLLDLLEASDPLVRRSAKKLVSRPFEPPHPPSTDRSGRRPASSKRDRTTPLALGPLVEAFFRESNDDLNGILAAQLTSQDALVRDAAVVFSEATRTDTQPRTKLAQELLRRRGIAQRAAMGSTATLETSTGASEALTQRLVEIVDASTLTTEPLATTEVREEALRALGELGSRSALPGLLTRASKGDLAAVDMLAAIGDPDAIAPLTDLLRREPQRYRLLEAGVVRALAGLDARCASATLRELLKDNPMPTWREGIERGVLVRELVAALGVLRDESAGPGLLEVLESTSQEYRAILPVAAWALGRIRYLPALTTLARILASHKDQATCEAVWAVGEIAGTHPCARAEAGEILDRLDDQSRLEPDAELVRLTALGKVRPTPGRGPRPAELRHALDRAIREPAFRQEESSRRLTWALRSLEELASARSAASYATFLSHETVRFFVTRDDHRVRQAAIAAFTAWGVPVPATRRYYLPVIDDLETRGGLDALHDALRDSLGIFRHNVATRLADRAHPSSVRPLAEATAKLFTEPPTSTYEYDDAPRHLVAFVRAVAKLNQRESNDVLIDGLRGGHHQVRAVVAENAPDDPRFVPELTLMLGDPRSFLRSRAERSLALLGVPFHQGA